MLKSRAFSLLELLLVLVVALGIILAGFSHYLQVARKKDIAVVTKNVDLIFQAFDDYYHENCKGSNFGIDIDIDKLNIKNKLLPSWLAAVDSYGVKVKRLNAKAPFVYQLQVFVTLNREIKNETANWYGQLLNAMVMQDGSLQWQRLPDQAKTSMHDDTWILDSGLHYFRTITTKDDNGCY